MIEGRDITLNFFYKGLINHISSQSMFNCQGLSFVKMFCCAHLVAKEGFKIFIFLEIGISSGFLYDVAALLHWSLYSFFLLFFEGSYRTDDK